MRVVSWNVFNRNATPPAKIADFLLAQDADVICLQEVPDPVLRELLGRDDTGYAHAVARGMRCAEHGECFLVILSRYPVIRHKKIRGNEGRGWRSFFSSVWHRLEEHLESHYIDVLTQEDRVRIFNVHLEVGTGPRNRLTQFLRVLRHSAHGKNIIAGDLNIYGETWYQRFIGLMWFGLQFRELLMDEREEFERVFSKFRLRNMFRGRTTFCAVEGAADFQFDHILLPEDAIVSSTSVFEEQCGSDHKLIIADVHSM